MAVCSPFEKKPHVAVAVSGGADSMALLLLAHQWAQAQGGRVTALTVDHGLRPESAQEAVLVANWCNQRGIAHHTMRWAPSVLSSAIQFHARLARYDLLTTWCREHHVLHLLTAHHRDDQVETFFFRLARGSGMDGLACMPMVSEMHGIRILRPLLTVTKPELEALLADASQPWLEDPTNVKDIYTRNAIRQKLAACEQHEEWHGRTATLSHEFGKIRNALENKSASYLTQVVSIYPEGYALIHHKAFLQLPTDIALRSLSSLTMTLSGEQYGPRTEKLERFYDDISTDRIRLRRSFGGLLFIRRLTKGYWLVCREPAAMQGTITLSDSESLLWDKRFRVSWAGDHQHMSVRALGADGIKLLLKEKYKPASQLEKAVLMVLPSFWHLEELVAVPHIGYARHDSRHMEFTAGFFPAKALAARAFFSMNT